MHTPPFVPPDRPTRQRPVAGAIGRVAWTVITLFIVSGGCWTGDQRTHGIWPFTLASNAAGTSPAVVNTLAANTASVSADARDQARRTIPPAAEEQSRPANPAFPAPPIATPNSATSANLRRDPPSRAGAPITPANPTTGIAAGSWQAEGPLPPVTESPQSVPVRQVRFAEPLPPVDPQLIAAPQTVPGPGQFEIPLQNSALADGQVRVQGNQVSISVRDAPLHSVLSLLGQQQGLSIVAKSDLTSPITVTLQPTTLENALDAIMAVSGCTWTRINNVIYVTSIAKDSPENFLVQGREVRVFNLSYAAAADTEAVVTGLLSPVGKVFTRQVDMKDKRKSAEQLVVEDLPPYMARVAEYVVQADQPPRQVMIEARLLQVKLKKDNRHGVNFDALARVAGANITVKSQAFTTGLGPAGIFTVDGTDFNSLIDCLSTTNDTKTLAAPKLLMINGQESKIQIGRRLGYFVTTTTQTSTLQDVQFLEVGVVLTVTPQITADGQILMKVHPKVSSGDINQTTTLPEEETTEVDTTILVPDGHGVIIGGLIQETDNDRQLKVPFLGDIWLAGRLFQRQTTERERSEVVVALMPRIVPYGACPTPQEVPDLERVAAPIVTPTLQSAPRPWEPKLPDAIRNPVWPRRTSPQ